LITASLPDRLRAFVAIRLSASSEETIADFIEELRTLRAGIRWTRRANLHLTIRFLGGDVPAAMVTALDAELDRIASNTAPLTLRARGCGVFPNLSRPRVVWIDLQGEPLIQLATRVEQAAQACGFIAEDRGYVPHLTIGRVRDLHRWSLIRSILVASADRLFGASTIDSMILYRSVLGPESSTYEELARYPLTAKP